MAKETFDRSKPHVNIGTQAATDGVDLAVVQLPGGGTTIQILDGDDGTEDDNVSVPIGEQDQLICHIDDAGLQFCLDTTMREQWDWDSFRLPLFVDGNGDPLLVQVKLHEVDGGLADFAMDDRASVVDGTIDPNSPMELAGPAADLEAFVGSFTPAAYTGDARVAGFVEVNVPEPTSALLILAAGAALVGRRLGRRRRGNPEA